MRRDASSLTSRGGEFRPGAIGSGAVSLIFQSYARISPAMRFRDRKTIGQRARARACVDTYVWEAYTGRRAGFNELPLRLSLHIYACRRVSRKEPRRRIFCKKFQIQTLLIFAK